MDSHTPGSPVLIGNKASEGDGIPAELFQILKDDAVKVLHSICQQIWKTQECPEDWKRLIFIPIPKKGCAKEYSNYRTIVLISHAVKECSKFSKLGFSSTWTENFQMYRLVLEKAEEPEIKLPFTVNLCFPGTPWNLRHWQLILHEVILVEMSLIDNAWKFLSSIKFTFGWGLYWLKEKKK